MVVMVVSLLSGSSAGTAVIIGVIAVRFTAPRFATVSAMQQLSAKAKISSSDIGRVGLIPLVLLPVWLPLPLSARIVFCPFPGPHWQFALVPAAWWEFV